MTHVQSASEASVKYQCKVELYKIFLLECTIMKKHDADINLTVEH